MRKWTYLVCSLALALAHPACIAPTGKYTVHVVFDDLDSANIHGQVRLYGEEVGEIEKCILLRPHQVLLDVTISKDVRIDRCDSLIFHEGLIGDSYIQLVRGRRLSVPGRKAVTATDTIRGIYEPLPGFGEKDKQQVMKRVKELIGTLDSIVHERDSTH